MSKRLPIFFKLLIIIIGVVFIFFPTQALAHHQKQVLADSTTTILPQIPPTAEGPGLILPDSPFFFLDRLKQNIRLFFALTPENRARVRAAIAGERLAELRFMLARNNKDAIETDLKGIADNLRDASDELNLAKLSGRNVSSLAKKLNNDIKVKQDILDILEKQVKGEMEALVHRSQAVLFESKVKVEDALPEQELENEIRDDLKRQVEERVEEASESARELQEDLNELHRQATESAQKSLKKREEALTKAIEEKNEALKKVEEKLLENEKKKQEALLKAQEKAAERAREALEKAQEAAQGFMRAQERVSEIRNQPVRDSSASF